jgi:hypothetical protein
VLELVKIGADGTMAVGHDQKPHDLSRGVKASRMAGRAGRGSWIADQGSVRWTPSSAWLSRPAKSTRGPSAQSSAALRRNMPDSTFTQARARQVFRPLDAGRSPQRESVQRALGRLLSAARESSHPIRLAATSLNLLPACIQRTSGTTEEWFHERHVCTPAQP